MSQTKLNTQLDDKAGNRSPASTSSRSWWREVQKFEADDSRTAEFAESPALYPSDSAEHEAALVAQTMSGDLAAFTDLVKLSERKVLSKAIRITRNFEDAEDVRQKAVMKAFLNLDRFEGRSRFSTWITRIAVNEALMTLRSRESHAHTSLDEMISAQDPRVLSWSSDQTEQPEHSYARQEIREDVAKEIANLRPQNRAVFVLRAVEQKSTSETAAALKISVCAVKSCFRRARIELRRRLSVRFKGHMQLGNAA